MVSTPSRIARAFLHPRMDFRFSLGPARNVTYLVGSSVEGVSTATVPYSLELERVTLEKNRVANKEHGRWGLPKSTRMGRMVEVRLKDLLSTGSGTFLADHLQPFRLERSLALAMTGDRVL